MSFFSSRTRQVERRRRGRGIRVLAALAIGAVALTGSLGASGAVAAVPAGSSASADAPLKAGRYIVTLVGDAASTYTGGVAGLPATAPTGEKQLNAGAAKVKDYSGYLAKRQRTVAADAGASITSSQTLASNAFSAHLSAKQAATLATDRRVFSVVKDEIVHPDAESSTDYLGLSGDDGVWNSVGGADAAGDGVVIGDLDTGIAPENPSFAGSPLGSTVGSAPYLAGDTTTFVKGDGGTFTGVCTTGVQWTASDCSTKIISARYFVDNFGVDNIGDASVGEYLSPRDGDGHGSHTASTAAGRHGVAASVSGVDYGSISGVAPGAKLAVYKVCWSGPDADSTDDDGCATSDILNAIDQAVADGVDAINYSIGSGAATSTVEVTDQAFLGAASAGVFVSASAGNDGAAASTVGNASPWITTVAASTIPSYEATATLGNGDAYAGASITVDRTTGATPLSGPLVRADLVAADGVDTADALLCGPDTLDPAQVEGEIVMCARGVYDRVAKSAEVKRAGGIGLLLVNPTPGSTDLDEHSVPTIHLDAQYYDAISAYAATDGATVTFTPENTTDVVTPVPQVAGFSSRGPLIVDDADILKPDVTAPGVSILADGANAEGEDSTYEFLSGTSMAAPHVTGLGALYLGVHPSATPAEIKSALMTTATDTVDANGDPVTDPFAQGAGEVDPTRYLHPGLLYLNGTADWYSYIQGVGFDVGATPIAASDLNLASISVGSLAGTQTVTRTVTATEAGTWTASTAGLAGATATVSPSTLTFDTAGESQSYTVTFERTDAPLDAWTTGSLTWTKGADTVRTPLAVQPVSIAAPDEVEGAGRTGSVDVAVTPGSTGSIRLSSTGLTKGIRLGAKGAAHSGSGSANDELIYETQVPSGTDLARFDLDAVDDTSDLDLAVEQLDGEGGSPVAAWQSATGSADERVDIADPDAGWYRVTVDVYAGSSAFDVDTFAVAPRLQDAALIVKPKTIRGTQGVETTYTASWKKLNADARYLGLVGYGDTGAQTIVSVDTAGAVLASSTTTLRLNRAVALRGGSVTATVHVASTAPVAGERVVVHVGKKDYSGVLSKNGVASIRLTALPRGLHMVTASFPGSDSVQPSESTGRRLLVV